MRTKQPVVRDRQGTLRFKSNEIVVALLKHCEATGLDLNRIFGGAHYWTQEDIDNFYQLIGYSISGYVDLSCISDESKNAAEAASNRLVNSGG